MWGLFPHFPCLAFPCLYLVSPLSMLGFTLFLHFPCLGFPQAYDHTFIGAKRQLCTNLSIISLSSLHILAIISRIIPLSSRYDLSIISLSSGYHLSIIAIISLSSLYNLSISRYHLSIIWLSSLHNLTIISRIICL